MGDRGQRPCLLSDRSGGLLLVPETSFPLIDLYALP